MTYVSFTQGSQTLRPQLMGLIPMLDELDCNQKERTRKSRVLYINRCCLTVVGRSVGALVGGAVGPVVGAWLGLWVGVTVGKVVGRPVGAVDGCRTPELASR